MVLPELLADQDSALLVLALLLLLWLWLLVNRRQEEQQWVPERPIALTVEDLGRKAFICARSNDLFQYRSLFINGLETRELLGAMAKEYLECRSPELLREALEDLNMKIPIAAVYVGLAATEGTELIIKIKVGATERDINIGTVTKAGNSWRLLQPSGGIAKQSV